MTIDGDELTCHRLNTMLRPFATAVGDLPILSNQVEVEVSPRNQRLFVPAPFIRYHPDRRWCGS